MPSMLLVGILSFVLYTALSDSVPQNHASLRRSQTQVVLQLLNRKAYGMAKAENHASARRESVPLMDSQAATSPENAKHVEENVAIIAVTHHAVQRQPNGSTISLKDIYANAIAQNIALVYHKLSSGH